MPSVLQGSLAPRRSLERPAPDLPGDAVWPPRARFSTPFHPRRALAGSPWAGLASTRPVADGCRASSSLGAACRLLQPDTTRGHTLRAVDPRTRVELSPRYSPAPTDAGCVGLRGALPHRGPASHDPYAPTCVRRVPLARTRRIAGRSARAKAISRALGRIRACPSRGASGTRVTGSIQHGGWRASAPRRAGRDLPLDAAPRRATPSKRSGCLLPHRNPYASGGLLLRARLDRGPFTPPLARHCSGARAPFSPFLRRLSLTSKAPDPARPTEPWEPEPPSQRPVAAPDTASTTESARGQMCRELHAARSGTN